jgi:glycosyltransferase involved in cell wall biosynthesis
MVGASTVLGIEPERITVLPRGVDTKRYRPGLDTAGLRRQLGLGDRTPVVLSPRYQVNESLYNFDVIIDAMVAVKERHPRVVCIQMHHPDQHRAIERLRALASERGLGDGYRLVPCVDNETMPLFYNLADVAVSVPSSDGFPVTVLEASACACPLVVSDLPYCKEWFVGRENGVIVPQRDPRALAAAICEVYEDRTLAQKIGLAGRRLVENKADYDKCMDQLESLYFALLAKGPFKQQEAT